MSGVPERPGRDQPNGAFERQFLASAERLRAAGVIESIVHDSATGNGVVTFTPACHELMLAGRQIFEEPGFLRAWMSGDPTLIRSWVESEAACLKPASTSGSPSPSTGLSRPSVHGTSARDGGADAGAKPK